MKARRTVFLTLLFLVVILTTPSAQYGGPHPCDSGPVITEWCANGTQDLCTPFHIGPTYIDPYNRVRTFDRSYWSWFDWAWMLHGYENGVEINILDGTRQHPFCEI